MELSRCHRREQNRIAQARSQQSKRLAVAEKNLNPESAASRERREAQLRECLLQSVADEAHIDRASRQQEITYQELLRGYEFCNEASEEVARLHEGMQNLQIEARACDLINQQLQDTAAAQARFLALPPPTPPSPQDPPPRPHHTPNTPPLTRRSSEMLKRTPSLTRRQTTSLLHLQPSDGSASSFNSAIQGRSLAQTTLGKETSVGDLLNFSRKLE